MRDFTDKIAVITGAAHGIGLALAKKAAAMKMKLMLADINSEALEDLQQQLISYTTTIKTCVVDVGSQTAMQNLAEQTITQLGVPQLIINNAGVGGPIGPIWEIPLTQINQTLDINLMSMVYSLQAFIPKLIQTKMPAHIINTASMAGFYSAPNLAAYEISKHGVVALTESLYHDLKIRAPHISVSLLCPGWVKTNIVKQFVNQISEEDFKTDAISDDLLLWLSKFSRSVKKGLAPDQVAEQVFDAIQNKKFYIFTDPTMKEAIIKDRLNSILMEQEPSCFTF